MSLLWGRLGQEAEALPSNPAAVVLRPNPNRDLVVHRATGSAS